MLKSCFYTERYVVFNSDFLHFESHCCFVWRGHLCWGSYQETPLLVVIGTQWCKGCSIQGGETRWVLGYHMLIECFTVHASLYNIRDMNEPDYVMKIMATHGVLEKDDTFGERYCCSGDDRVSFKNEKPCDWHFCYHHAVDDHNNLHHALAFLEDTWLTQR